MNKQLSDAEIVRFYPGSNSTSDFVACARKVIAAALAGTEPSDFVIAELQNIASADIKNFVATNPHHEFFLWAQNRARHTLAKISEAALAHKSDGAVAELSDEQIEAEACLYSLDLANGLDWCFDDFNLKAFVRAILLMSAGPIPVQHDSDCSTNNRGVPELLGPCDCSAAAPAAPVAVPVDASDWAPTSETLVKRLRDPVDLQPLIDMPERMREAINVIDSEAADAIESLQAQLDEANYLIECGNNAVNAAARATQADPAPHSGEAAPVAMGEAVAKWLEKKADDHAEEYGHDDMGSLSFGAGRDGDAKHEYHSNLLELAEEARAFFAAQPQAAPSGLSDALNDILIEHRIALEPEHEGQWHADLYGEYGCEPIAHAEGSTPIDAARNAIAAASATGSGA